MTIWSVSVNITMPGFMRTVPESIGAVRVLTSAHPMTLHFIKQSFGFPRQSASDVLAAVPFFVAAVSLF